MITLTYEQISWIKNYADILKENDLARFFNALLRHEEDDLAIQELLQYMMVNIPDCLSYFTYIPSGLFYDISTIDGVPFSFAKLSDLCTDIREDAFQSCVALSQIDLGNSIKYIRKYAFNNCGNLQSIKLPEGLEEIGDYAFGGCTSLTEFTIPKSVTKWGSDILFGCNFIQKVYVPEHIIKHWQKITVEELTHNNPTNISYTQQQLDIVYPVFYKIYLGLSVGGNNDTEIIMY